MVYAGIFKLGAYITLALPSYVVELVCAASAFCVILEILASLLIFGVVDDTDEMIMHLALEPTIAIFLHVVEVVLAVVVFDFV